MAHVRFLVYFFVLLVIVTCVCARARTWDDFNHYEKRIFGCAELGKSCSGLFSKSCCNGYKCHSTSGLCVSSGSSGSWLDYRNGK